MRGTEKQIAWATEIIGNVTLILEQRISDVEKMPGDDAKKAAHIADVRRRLDAIKNADYAGDVIEVFGRTHFSGDQRRDWATLVSMYRITLPTSAGSKKILCK